MKENIQLKAFWLVETTQSKTDIFVLFFGVQAKSSLIQWQQEK